MNEIGFGALILALAGCLSFTFLISNLPAIMVYGTPLRGKEVVPFLKYALPLYEYDQAHPRMLFLNQVNGVYIHGPFISTIARPIFFKYYINGYGLIWRWSKAHRMIRERFEEGERGGRQGLSGYLTGITGF